MTSCTVQVYNFIGNHGNTSHVYLVSVFDYARESILEWNLAVQFHVMSPGIDSESIHPIHMG